MVGVEVAGVGVEVVGVVVEEDDDNKPENMWVHNVLDIHHHMD